MSFHNYHTFTPFNATQYYKYMLMTYLKYNTTYNTGASVNPVLYFVSSGADILKRDFDGIFGITRGILDFFLPCTITHRGIDSIPWDRVQFILHLLISWGCHSSFGSPFLADNPKIKKKIHYMRQCYVLYNWIYEHIIFNNSFFMHVTFWLF